MAKTAQSITFFRILGIALLIVGCIGFFHGWGQIQSETLLVLTFHGVMDNPGKPWEISFGELVEKIHGLKRYGFEALPPEDFQRWWGGELSGGRHFLVTFDDGLLTSGTAIKKLKTDEGIRPILFVVTDLMGKPGYLGADDLRELASGSGCAFGLHGKTHEEPPKVIKAGRDLAEELRSAKSVLEAIVGKTISMYAYPFGEFDPDSKDAVASAGITFGFTIESRAIDRGNDALLLPRLMYLRGVEAVGEPTISDWMPPREARLGGLTLTLAMFVFLLALRMFIRAAELSRQKSKKT